MTRRDICRKCVEIQRQHWMNDSNVQNMGAINASFDKELHWIDKDLCPFHHRADEKIPVQEMIDHWPGQCFFTLELIVAEKP